MRLFEKIRIRKKIRKIYQVLNQLPEDDKEECIDKIVHVLQSLDNRKKKERFFDIILERFAELCQ